MGSDMIIAAEQSGSGAFNLLLLLAVPLVFYFLLIRPQSKRRKEQLQMQSALEPGARVLTTSGMYAEVVSVDDDGIELEIAPGVRARFVKQAVMQVVKDEDVADEVEDDDPADDTELAEDAETRTDLKKGGDVETADAGSGDEDGKPAAQGAGAGKGLKKSSD
ncbi:preprotein translocase subunit YajC [Actinomadura viridis]|uniref:preprotein translocase subunit YajC n=1 Tax=Actinomadura viridis TaxID=58110 RepID=UPI0036A607B2